MVSASTSNGKLTLMMSDGSTTKSVSSSAVYTQQNQWTFFAVTFDERPSSNEVSFYVGTDTASVTLVNQASVKPEQHIRYGSGAGDDRLWLRRPDG